MAIYLNQKKFHDDGLEGNSERDIKSVLQIDYQFTLMRSIEKFWKGCNKI